MKRLLLILALLFPAAVMAQTGAVNGYCERGGWSATLSGLSSTNYFNNIIPSCTVTVFLTGTQTKATLYSDIHNTPLSNPFTGDALGTAAPGKWLFFAATSQGYDIVMSGGISPIIYPTPITLTDVFSSSGGGGGSGNCDGAAGFFPIIAPGGSGCVDSPADYGVSFPNAYTFPATSAGGAGNGEADFNITLTQNGTSSFGAGIYDVLIDNGANDHGAQYNYQAQSDGTYGADYEMVLDGGLGPHAANWELDTQTGNALASASAANDSANMFINLGAGGGRNAASYNNSGNFEVSTSCDNFATGTSCDADFDLVSASPGSGNYIVTTEASADSTSGNFNVDTTGTINGGGHIGFDAATSIYFNTDTPSDLQGNGSEICTMATGCSGSGGGTPTTTGLAYWNQSTTSWGTSYTPNGASLDVFTGAPLTNYAIPADNGSTHDLTSSGVAAIPTGLTSTQISTILTTLPAAILTNNSGFHVPFSPSSGSVPATVIDTRADIPAHMVSVKEGGGAQCDEGGRGSTPTYGTVTTTMGSNTITVNSYGFTGFLVTGWSIAVVGTVGGVPTAWEPIITGGSGPTYTTFGNAPFSISAAIFTYGTDDTASIQNLIYDSIGFPVTADFTGSTLSLPGGVCFVHTLIGSGGVPFYGQGRTRSAFAGFPGEDALDANDPSNPDPVIGYQGGAFGDLDNFSVWADTRIDARKAWTQVVTFASPTCNQTNLSGCTTQTINHTPLTRHFGRNSIHSNNPLAPSWCTGVDQIDGGFCTNGVASVTNGVDTITVATTEAVPANGETVVFPYLTPAFKATVVSSAGQVVTLSATYPGTTSGQQEWMAGSAFQTLNGNITSSSTSLITNLSLVPTAIENVAGVVGSHGLIQIDSEQISYFLVNYGSSQLLNLTRGVNGTTAASHTSGALIVPLNPITPASPWPVIPTLTASVPTPSNAEYYPSDAVGNAAIAYPMVNGTPTNYSTTAHMHWDNLYLGTIEGADTTNGTVGLMLEQIPYYPSYDNIWIDGPDYGVIQTAPLDNYHYFAILPDPGGEYNHFSIIAQHIAWLEFGGSTVKFSDWDSNNSGSGIEFGFELADTNFSDGTQQSSAMGNASLTNIYYELNNNTIGNFEPTQWFCDHCNGNNFHLNGASPAFFSGVNSTYTVGNFGGANLTYPYFIWGNDQHWSNILNTNFQQSTSNAYGSSSIVNFGIGDTFNGSSANGGPALNSLGPGGRSLDFNVQSGEFLLTANVGANQYINANSGIIYPDEFEAVSFNVDAFPVNLPNNTAPLGGEVMCPGTDSFCNAHLFNAFPVGGIAIEPLSRITPQKYTVYVPYKVDAGTPTFNIKVQVWISGTPTTLATMAVTGSTSWQPASADIDLSSYTGDTIGIEVDSFSDSTKRYYLGGFELAPVAANLIALGMRLEGQTGCISADANGNFSGSGSACGAGGSGPTLEVNGSNTSNQSILNIINSTVNAAGLALTASNPSGGNVKYEITGSPISVGGITVTGTPSTGQVLTATSTTAADWQAAPGSGTVTSVGLSAGGIFGATGTPVTGSGTLTLTVAGTSGGIPYFSSSSVLSSSAALNHFGVLYGGGTGGAPASSAADTTTTHALFATAGAPAFRAITGADLPLFSSSLAGAVAASGGGTTNFLRADGSWASPPGGITGSGTAGKIPLWSGASAIGNSACDQGVTTANTLTCALSGGFALTGSGPGKLSPATTTIGSLPAASSVSAGSMIVVSDSTTFTVGTCTGGGSDYMIAISNGSSWSCH